MAHRVRCFFPILAVLAGLSGCASHKTVSGGPEAEEAAIRLESSRQEYYDCIKTEGPGRPNCDSLEALYKKDREAYENAAR